MKSLFTILAVVVVALTSSTESLYAQKLVIGSKVDISKADDALVWLNGAPTEGKKMVIDFFSAKNPSSVSFYNEHLERLANNLGGDYEIIILSASDSEELRTLVAEDKEKYHFAVDAEGELFKLFDVQFLPYSVVVDSKKILWLGNLSTLDSSKF